MILLDEWLSRKQMTGKQLAKRVGTSEVTITKIKKGGSAGFDLIVKIADALEIDVRELVSSTKGVEFQTIFIKEDGVYIPVGNIKKGR